MNFRFFHISEQIPSQHHSVGKIMLDCPQASQISPMEIFLSIMVSSCSIKPEEESLQVTFNVKFSPASIAGRTHFQVPSVEAVAVLVSAIV